MVTAALARKYVNAGKRVQIFKIGPDYLDPTILEVASNNQVYNLDLWMMGENHCRYLLSKAAATHDIILVESVMGLYDHSPSSVAMASLFDLPITLVINAAKFAQTAAAIVQGIKHFGTGQETITLNGVIGNFIGSNRHHQLLEESVSAVSPYLGSIRRNPCMNIPLGIWQCWL